MNAKVHPIATFKPDTFFENIIVRSDGSILVTAITPKVLYYLPPTPRIREGCRSSAVYF
jgi:hypothetical protein